MKLSPTADGNWVLKSGLSPRAECLLSWMTEVQHSSRLLLISKVRLEGLFVGCGGRETKILGWRTGGRVMLSGANEGDEIENGHEIECHVDEQNRSAIFF